MTPSESYLWKEMSLSFLSWDELGRTGGRTGGHHCFWNKFILPRRRRESFALLFLEMMVTPNFSVHPLASVSPSSENSAAHHWLDYPSTKLGLGLGVDEARPTWLTWCADERLVHTFRYGESLKWMPPNKTKRASYKLANVLSKIVYHLDMPGVFFALLPNSPQW